MKLFFAEFYSLGNFGNGRRRQNQNQRQWKYPKHLHQAGIKAAPKRVQSYNYHPVPNYRYKDWYEWSQLLRAVHVPLKRSHYVSTSMELLILWNNLHGEKVKQEHLTYTSQPFYSKSRWILCTLLSSCMQPCLFWHRDTQILVFVVYHKWFIP